MNWCGIIDILEQKFPNRSLARELGVRSQYISDLKSGKSKNPGSDFVLRLIEKFGLNPTWLLSESGNGDMFIKPPTEINGEVATIGYKVPLLRQKVSCGPGQNWESEENIDRYVDVFDIVPRLKTGKIYALPVTGSSMLGVGIRNGDVVLFDAAKDQDTHDGIYVFSIDGDVYCKRLEFDALTRQIKVYSVRVADLEKAELAMSFKADETALADRLQIFGRVFAWIHPED